MTTGTPDYGIVVNQPNEPQSSDTLELAARQGVYCQNNRSGNVIFNIGDAILTNSSLTSSTGTGFYSMPSPKYSYYGRPLLKVVTGTLSTDNTNVALNTPPFSGLQVGVEALMMMYSILGTITLGIQIGRTNYSAYAQVRVNIQSGAVQVYNAAGAWESAGTIAVYGGTGSLFSMKFSVDLSTYKYGYLWYGSEQSISLQSHTCTNSVGGGGDTNILSWQYTNATIGSLTIYLGDIITTINEVI